jgi:hypothetical protein
MPGVNRTAVISYPIGPVIKRRISPVCVQDAGIKPE